MDMAHHIVLIRYQALHALQSIHILQSSLRSINSELPRNFEGTAFIMFPIFNCHSLYRIF
jgi:hypothetical protein